MSKKIYFNNVGTFEALYSAQAWLSSNGYGYGSSSVGNPIAITEGDYYAKDLPHKMKNFAKEDYTKIVGVITGDIRNGPVSIEIYKKSINETK